MKLKSNHMLKVRFLLNLCLMEKFTFKGRSKSFWTESVKILKLCLVMHRGQGEINKGSQNVLGQILQMKAI